MRKVISDCRSCGFWESFRMKEQSRINISFVAGFDRRRRSSRTDISLFLSFDVDVVFGRGGNACGGGGFELASHLWR